MESSNNTSIPSQMIQELSPEQLERQRLWEEQRQIWTKKQKEIEMQKQNRFKKLGLLTLLYALFYTFCMYDNLSSITMPLWILATIFYACYALQQFEVPRKKDGLFHIIIMMLLGISTVFTGNPYVIAMNYIGFFLLLLAFLFHTIYDDKEWGIGTFLWNVTVSILHAIELLTAPLSDGIAFRKLHTKKENKKLSYVILGFVMAVPIILILTAILASADAVFGDMLNSALTCFVLPSNWFGVMALFAFAYFSAYCGLCQLLKGNHTASSAIHSKRKLSPIIAITFTSPITLLYVMFSIVQIIYLFLGFGTLPDGISYAEYARTGFFQLLFVCFLNFTFVLLVQFFVDESRILRGLLLTICGSTFIMITSSAYRMLLYIVAYQLTFLRIFVLVALTVIALLMGGVVFSLYKKQFQLYKYSLIVVSIIYLCFSFSHVDYFIASYNLSHAEASSLEDTLQYISTLSSDAAPAIADYMIENSDWIYDVDKDTSWYLKYSTRIQTLSENSSLRRFNVSHYIASNLINQNK